LQSQLIKSAIFLNDSENEQGKLDIDSQKSQLKSIGENQKKILIISNHSIDDTSSNEHQLLINMLKAVKLDLNDVKLFEYSEKVIFKKLISLYEAEICLFFGIIPKDINLNIIGQYYRILPFHNRKIVFAEELSIINDKKESKEAIWKNLKKLFQ